MSISRLRSGVDELGEAISAALLELRGALRMQRPEPLPAGLGGVVRLHNGSLAVRADSGNTVHPWRMITDDDFWLSDEDVATHGFTVLSKGWTHPAEGDQ